MFKKEILNNPIWIYCETNTQVKKLLEWVDLNASGNKKTKWKNTMVYDEFKKVFICPHLDSFEFIVKEKGFISFEDAKEPYAEVKNGKVIKGQYICNEKYLKLKVEEIKNDVLVSTMTGKNFLISKEEMKNFSRFPNIFEISGDCRCTIEAFWVDARW
jgi:hypothetical protein